MLELGEESLVSHSRLGECLKESNLDEVFFFGSEMKAAVEEYGFEEDSAFFSEDYRVLEEAVLGSVQPGDLLLLKGSRGMELERLSLALSEKGHCDLVLNP
jgi:UDP-N-acetylmuramoyl-tripeptide--D-alanyl-D-alanine ligase